MTNIDEREYDLTYGQAADALHRDPSKLFEIKGKGYLLGYCSEGLYFVDEVEEGFERFIKAWTTSKWNEYRLREYKPKPKLIQDLDGLHYEPTLKELKEMNNKDKDEYNIDIYDAMRSIIEDDKKFIHDQTHTNGYKIYLYKNKCKQIKWFCKKDHEEFAFAMEENLKVKFKEYVPKPKLITWYEADKVYLVDAGIVVEAEYMGKSKEAVIKFIDACSTSDFEVLNWKEKQLPENPKEWTHD